MNAELPPFKKGGHNSESVSTLDHYITPSMKFFWYGCKMYIHHPSELHYIKNLFQLKHIKTPFIQ